MFQRYTVYGDGKGGCKLRAEPATASAPAGEAPFGAEVRIDKVHELPGQKLRAHICESRGKKKSPDGWTTAMLLTCTSGICGRCHGCGAKDVLPSQNYKPVTIEVDFTEEGKDIGLELKRDSSGPEAHLVKISGVQNEDIKGLAHADMHIEQVGDAPTAELSLAEVQTLLDEALRPCTVKLVIRDMKTRCEDDLEKLQMQAIIDKMSETIRSQRVQLSTHERFHQDLKALFDWQGEQVLADKSNDEIITTVTELLEQPPPSQEEEEDVEPEGGFRYEWIGPGYHKSKYGYSDLKALNNPQHICTGNQNYFMPDGNARLVSVFLSLSRTKER